jgi:hypothetical protein
LGQGDDNEIHKRPYDVREQEALKGGVLGLFSVFGKIPGYKDEERHVETVNNDKRDIEKRPGVMYVLLDDMPEYHQQDEYAFDIVEIGLSPLFLVHGLSASFKLRLGGN